MKNLSEIIQENLMAMLDGKLEGTDVSPDELNAIKTEACQIVVDAFDKL